MAECSGELWPPDVERESDQTEADSEFREEGRADADQIAQTEGADANTERLDLSSTENGDGSSAGLERTESSGHVQETAGGAWQPEAGDAVAGSVGDGAVGRDLLSVDVKTPDSASSDDIQCLAEEDRDDRTDTDLETGSTEASHSLQRFCETESGSQVQDSTRSSFKSQTPEDVIVQVDPDQQVPFESLEESVQSESEEVDRTLHQRPRHVDLDGASALETDQPECDINSGAESSGVQGAAAALQGDVDTENVNNSCVKVTREELAVSSSIPRVSSQGAIGQIQNSVQALIDKTSAFLDSGPSSTLSSMSDLDQAGLDTLSCKFDSIRFDTPSPVSTSPQHVGQSGTSPRVAVSPDPAQDLQVSSQFDGKRSDERSVDPVVQVQTRPDTDEDLLSQLDAELDTSAADRIVTESRSVESVDTDNHNGFLQRTGCLEQTPEYSRLMTECEALRKKTDQQQDRIKSLQDRESQQSVQIESIARERDALRANLESLQGKSTDEIYQAQVTELESTIAQQTKDLVQIKDKLASHDAAAKRAVQTLQNELKKRVDEVTKLYEETKKEKDAMVMKYAMAEQKSIEATDRMAKTESRMKEVAREREMMIQRFTQLKKNREMALAALEARNKEVVGMKKAIEAQKEAISSQETKTKWTQNKLKVEEDAHKETKAKLDELNRRLNEQREEALILRKDCQAMIKTYQESEEIKSNSLDHELKKKESELLQQVAAKNEVEEVHAMLRKELDSLKAKHKDMMAELKTYKDRVQCLEAERLHQEKSLNAFKETLQSQKQDNEAMRGRLLELENIEEDVISVKERNARLVARNDELEQSNGDLQGEMDGCARREQEHLEFTQKISEKNSSLQADNNRLDNKVQGLTAEVERLTSVCEMMENKIEKLERELEGEKKSRKEELDSLSVKLAEKSRVAEQLTIDLEDQRDENKTIKRRHTSNMKDLTRQLHQVKKKLELHESKECGKDSTSMGSRTSSTTSLETNNHNGAVSKSPTEPTSPDTPEYPEVRIIEVDKQMLIEKIVKLQKAHAKKSEKIEFMDDHISQLLEEVKKKAKIIQMYALREESGTLAPESMDHNKAALAKKSGIMASLYSMHQQDGSMTLDLSLEINKKLQAVLEDTLLKNITIKSNLETLGQEIARLSQENRQLQLDVQASRKS